MLVLADIGALPPDLRDRLAPVRRRRRRAAALCRHAARRRGDRRPVAGAPAPRRPRARRRAVVGQPAHARAVRPREPVLRPDAAGDVGITRQLLAEPDADLVAQDLGRARRRHADHHRRAARTGPDRARPRHRRHDLVEPAAVRPVRRHAAQDRGARRHRRRAGQARPAAARRCSPPRCARSTASASFNAAARHCPARRRRRRPRRHARPSAGLLRLAGRADRGQHAGCRRKARPGRFLGAGRPPRADACAKRRSTCGPGSWRSRCSASRSTPSPSSGSPAGSRFIRRRAARRPPRSPSRAPLGACARWLRPATRWRRPRSPPVRPAAAERPPISPKEADAALATRFAYVLTGDAAVDEISRAGLAGLGQLPDGAHRARPGRTGRRRSRPATSCRSIR